MSTTALFAELLVVGLQASVWLALMIFTTWGYEWLPPLVRHFNQWSTMVVILYLAAAYSVGLVLDRAFDAAAYVVGLRDYVHKNAWLDRRAGQVLADTRVAVHLADGTLAEYQRYVLSRTRIARSTFFNVVLISSTALVFTASRPVDVAFKIRALTAVLAWSIVAVPLSLAAYAMLEKTLEVRNQQIQDHLATKPLAHK